MNKDKKDESSSEYHIRWPIDNHRIEIPLSTYDFIQESIKDDASEITGNNELNFAGRSDENYNTTVNRIIGIADIYLPNHQKSKGKIRMIFMILFSALLILQLLATILFIWLSAVSDNGFNVNPTIMTTFIVSIFVETLSIVGIMIKFAFEAKDEVTIIKLLSDIVKNYKKFELRKKSLFDTDYDSDDE